MSKEQAPMPVPFIGTKISRKRALQDASRPDNAPLAAHEGLATEDRHSYTAQAGIPYGTGHQILPLDHNNIEQVEKYHSNLADAAEVLTGKDFYRNKTFETANTWASGLAQLNVQQIMQQQAASAEGSASELSGDNAEALSEAYAQVAKDRQMIQSMVDSLQQLLQLKNV